MSKNIRVTVWGENVHEKKHQAVADIYPKGMHETIAEALRESSGLDVRTATLDQPEHGLTEEVLEKTDVLTWWGHAAHSQVEDKIVDRVQEDVFQFGYFGFDITRNRQVDHEDRPAAPRL